MIHAKKSLGQNFLIDHEALSDIAYAIPVTGKRIIEVGPGYGALTDYLFKEMPKSLDLVELDTDMIKILETRMRNGEWGTVHEEISRETGAKISTVNQVPFTLHHQDILQFIPTYGEYSVIANIPYYITSPILFHFLYPLSIPVRENDHETILGTVSEKSFSPPQDMVIMMQEEVGEKILGGHAKKPHHSLLSLAMEQACEAIEMVRYVPRESFDPMPKVDSIVLRFTVRKDRNIKEELHLINFWKVVFAHPRKTLISNLKGGGYDTTNTKMLLKDLGYDEKVRAEAVKREDWKKIFLSIF